MGDGALSLSAKVIAELVAAGVTGDALVRIAKAIEESDALVRTASVTPGALRMRKLREKREKEREQEAHNVTHEGEQAAVPTYSSNNSSLSEIDSSKEKDMSEKPKRASPRARRSIDYTDTFKTFWADYPSDPGMSKADAFMEFQKISEEDQAAAIKSLPAFKVWIPKQGKDYRTIHACNYLKQRRFDGFMEAAKAIESIKTTKVWVAYGTPAGDAWEAWYKAQGKIASRDGRNGWWQPSEWPPEQQSSAA